MLDMGTNSMKLTSKIICLAPIALAIAACQPTPEISKPLPPTPQNCDLRLQNEIGAPITAVSVPAGNKYRVIRPGDVVTQDYRIDRTNIELDENDRIARVACG